MMQLRLILALVLVVLSTAARAGQDSVLPLSGAAENGVGFRIAENVLVTSARLGAPVYYNGVPLEPLLAQPSRGVSLWKVEPASPVNLAEKSTLSRTEKYFFHIPHPIAAEAIEVSNDTSRSQVRGEAWLVKTPVRIPLGAPLLRESDQRVVGAVVQSVEKSCVVVPVEAIRVCCFDARIVLPSPPSLVTAAQIIRNWPYGGRDSQEYHLADAHRLEAWRDIVGLLPTYSTSIVNAGDLLYLGDREGQIFCIDSKQRTSIWSQNLDWPVIFPPVVAGDSLYITVFGLQLEMRENSFIFRRRHWSASGSSTLYAFNRSTGEVRWRHISGLRTAPIVKDGYVFFGGLGGYGVLQSDTGKSVWINGNPLTEEERPFWYLIQPPVGDTWYVLAIQMRLHEKQPRRILLASGEMKLLKLEAKTGKVISQVKLGKLPDSQHPFAAAWHLQASENRLTVAVGQTARQYNTVTGRLVWERPLGATLVPGAIARDDLFFLPTEKPQILALDTRSGDLVWEFNQLTGAPGHLLSQDNQLVFGALDGRLYSLMATDGRCDWSVECPGGKINGAPAYLGGCFFSAASDGKIYLVAPPAAQKTPMSNN